MYSPLPTALDHYFITMCITSELCRSKRILLHTFLSSQSWKKSCVCMRFEELHFDKVISLSFYFISLLLFFFSYSSLLCKLPAFAPPGSKLYIATNERKPHFFDPLKSIYDVYMLEDFNKLWSKGSQWERNMRPILGKKANFDTYMQVTRLLVVTDRVFGTLSFVKRINQVYLWFFTNIAGDCGLLPPRACFQDH